MSEAKGIVRNTGFLASARLIERAGNFVLAAIIGRKLGPEGFGVYATAIAYFGIIATAAESGTTNLLVREIAGNRERTADYLFHGALLTGGVALVVSISGFGIVELLDYPGDLENGVKLILLALVPGVLNTVQEAVFVAYQRVEFEALSTLGAQILIIVVSIVLLERGYGVLSLIFAFVVAEFAITIFYFVLINRQITKLTYRFDRVFARRLIRDVRPFAGSSLLQAGMSRPEILILSAVATPAEVGYYSAALKIADFWQFFPSVYMINVFPVLSRLFRENVDRFKRIQDVSLKFLLAFGLPLAVGTVVTAGPIMRAFYGPEFDPGIICLRILGGVIVFYCISAVLWRVLSARGEQSRVLRSQVVTLVFRLAGGFAIISVWAATGAAVTMLASLAVYTAMVIWQVESDGTRVSIWASWRCAVAAGLMGLGVGLAEWQLGVADKIGPELSLYLGMLILLGGAIYAVLIVALRAFSPDERRLIFSVLPARLRRRFT